MSKKASPRNSVGPEVTTLGIVRLSDRPRSYVLITVTSQGSKVKDIQMSDPGSKALISERFRLEADRQYFIGNVAVYENKETTRGATAN